MSRDKYRLWPGQTLVQGHLLVLILLIRYHSTLLPVRSIFSSMMQPTLLVKPVVLLVGVVFFATPVKTATFVCEDDFDCLPNGTCGPSQSCVCQPGFSGTQCEYPCPLQCQNGGQCMVIDQHGGAELDYYCECPSTHGGGLCNNPLSFVCEDDFDCLPNGTCNNLQRCVCNPGYDGEQCDQPCPLRCENGGQCVVLSEHGGAEPKYHCKCPADYTGGLCQSRSGSVFGSPSDRSSQSSSKHTLGVILGLILSLGTLAIAMLIVLRRRQTFKQSVASKQKAVDEEAEAKQERESGAITGEEDRDIPPID